MIAELERRLTELRFIEGIEKVEHVPYPTGDQFWVRFNQPVNMTKLSEITKRHGYQIIRFATLPSKMPRGIAEMLWDGVTHVIVKQISGWSEFTSRLGFEPEGMAKLAIDLHGPFQIFMATEEEGIQLLYEYLDLKYVPPAPPQPIAKPVAPAKTPAPAVNPEPPATPSPAPAVKPSTTSPPQTVPTAKSQAANVPQPAPLTAAQTTSGQTTAKKENAAKNSSSAS